MVDDVLWRAELIVYSHQGRCSWKERPSQLQRHSRPQRDSTQKSELMEVEREVCADWV